MIQEKKAKQVSSGNHHVVHHQEDPWLQLVNYWWEPDARFIEKLYEILLKRGPHPSEVPHQLLAIQKGYPRAELAKSFLLSEEAKEHHFSHSWLSEMYRYAAMEPLNRRQWLEEIQDDYGYVHHCYLRILGREGLAEEISSHLKNRKYPLFRRRVIRCMYRSLERYQLEQSFRMPATWVAPANRFGMKIGQRHAVQAHSHHGDKVVREHYLEETIGHLRNSMESILFANLKATIRNSNPTDIVGSELRPIPFSDQAFLLPHPVTRYYLSSRGNSKALIRSLDLPLATSAMYQLADQIDGMKEVYLLSNDPGYWLLGLARQSANYLLHPPRFHVLATDSEQQLLQQNFSIHHWSVANGDPEIQIDSLPSSKIVDNYQQETCVVVELDLAKIDGLKQILTTTRVAKIILIGSMNSLDQKSAPMSVELRSWLEQLGYSIESNSVFEGSREVKNSEHGNREEGWELQNSAFSHHEIDSILIARWDEHRTTANSRSSPAKETIPQAA